MPSFGVLLASFDVGMQWVDDLFAALLRPPLEGYSPVTLRELVRADQELWRGMATATRAGITARADGPRPLQEAMLQLMISPGVIHLLPPLPRVASRISREAGGTKRDRAPGKTRSELLFAGPPWRKPRQGVRDIKLANDHHG